jgi:hypothetical protein
VRIELLKAVIFAFAVFSIYLLELVILGRFILVRLGFLTRHKRGRVLRIAAICLHVVAVGGILCIIYAFLIEPRWIEVVNVDVPTERLKHATLTVVQISDLHCDPAPGNEDQVVRIVNDLHPDIIVFTGDAVNSPKGLPIFRDTLSRLKANIGKFAVRGNIDRNYLDEELVRGTGFQMLDGICAVAQKDGESFCIVGISDSRAGQIQDILAKAPKGMFTIFLHHYPHFVEEIYPGQVDLSLSGHIHGGQVALPFYGAIMTFSPAGKEYERGIYHTRGALLYVNRGIGTENTPIRARFMARPEITVFHIHPAGESN